jgi:hypothetical protein
MLSKIVGHYSSLLLNGIDLFSKKILEFLENLIEKNGRNGQNG